jgi:hypothetical protein
MMQPDVLVVLLDLHFSGMTGLTNVADLTKVKSMECLLVKWWCDSAFRYSHQPVSECVVILPHGQ